MSNKEKYKKEINKKKRTKVIVGGDGAFLDGGYGGFATITRMSFSSR